MSDLEQLCNIEELMVETVWVRVKVGERIEYRFKSFDGEEDDPKDDTREEVGDKYEDWRTYETVTNPALIQEFEKAIEEKKTKKRLELEKRQKELEEEKKQLLHKKEVLERKKRKLDGKIAELEMEEKRLKLSEEKQPLSLSQPPPPVAVAEKEAIPNLPEQNEMTKSPAPVPMLLSIGRRKRRPSKKLASSSSSHVPKRPLAAFFLFCKDERPKLQRESQSQDKPFGQIRRELGQMWKNTTYEIRNRYTLLAMEDKKRYNKEMEDYQKACAH